MQKIEIFSCDLDGFIQSMKTAMEEVVKGQKSNDQTPKTELLNRNEVAKLLQISLPTLNVWTKAGRIPSYRIGSRIRYKRNEVLDSLNAVGKYKKGGQSEK